MLYNIKSDEVLFELIRNTYKKTGLAKKILLRLGERFFSPILSKLFSEEDKLRDIYDSVSPEISEEVAKNLIGSGDMVKLRSFVRDNIQSNHIKVNLLQFALAQKNKIAAQFLLSTGIDLRETRISDDDIAALIKIGEYAATAQAMERVLNGGINNDPLYELFDNLGHLIYTDQTLYKYLKLHSPEIFERYEYARAKNYDDVVLRAVSERNWDIFNYLAENFPEQFISTRQNLFEIAVKRKDVEFLDLLATRFGLGVGKIFLHKNMAIKKELFNIAEPRTIKAIIKNMLHSPPERDSALIVRVFEELTQLHRVKEVSECLALAMQGDNLPLANELALEILDCARRGLSVDTEGLRGEIALVYYLDVGLSDDFMDILVKATSGNFDNEEGELTRNVANILRSFPPEFNYYQTYVDRMAIEGVDLEKILKTDSGVKRLRDR